MKKYLSFILALLLLISTAACGNAPATQTSEPSASPATEPAAPSEPSAPTEPRERITLSIGMPDNSKILDFEENALTRWVEAKCDVELEFVLYPKNPGDISADAAKKQMYRPLPDILYGIGVNQSWIPQYGQDGVFRDLTDYYKDKDGASRNFWNRMEDCLTEEQQAYVLSRITDADSGKIYGVPDIKTYKSQDRTYQPWINQVWLDQLGLSMPTSTEELYRTLKTFREEKPGDDSTIPLFGSEKASPGASVVDWIINMFIYYHPDRLWQDYNGDGQLELVYTQDAYRDALKFLNKLYRESLLSNMLYTASSSDMKAITTPDSGVPMCGVFLGDLTNHTTEGNGTLYEYVPMPLWGYAVEEDFYCNLNSFITKDCEDVDRAFEVLMALWSWEGTMRVRYGEYGENWTDADPGAVSAMGYPAEYKVISDPISEANSAHWGTISCGLFDYLIDGSNAQTPDDFYEWRAVKGEMEAASRALFDEAQSHNPEKLCPYLSYTLEQWDQINELRYPILNLAAKYEKDFIQGFVSGEETYPPLDVNTDEVWNAYLQELEALGLTQYTQIVQTAYERQKG